METDTLTLARDWGHAASEGFADAAGYLKALPGDAWHDPTGATEWDMRYLAVHIAGEAVWFPNLVRVATRGDKPLPNQIYTDMKGWPADRVIGSIAQAADDLRSTMDEMTPSDVEKTVDVGWATVPIWQGTYISLIEGVFHDWDTKAGRDPDATVPTPWAQQVARGLQWFGPMIAHGRAASKAPGTYLLDVSDGIGPITVTVQDGRASLTQDRASHPVVTLRMNADQYARFIVGRLDLQRAMDGGKVQVEGDADRAMDLKRIFGGIANGD